MTNQHQNPWTEEEKKLATELKAAGVSASQSAAQLPGRTRNAVIGFWQREGLSSPRPEPGLGKTKRSPEELEFRRQAAREYRRNLRQQKKAFIESAPDGAAVPRRIAYRGECPPPVVPLGLSLLELSDSQCKWPGDDAGPYTFCGHPRDAASPAYCSYHRWIGTKPTPMWRA